MHYRDTRVRGIDTTTTIIDQFFAFSTLVPAMDPGRSLDQHSPHNRSVFLF
jgi:hypothetical protein